MIKFLSVIFSRSRCFSVVALAFYHLLRVGEWHQFVLGELGGETSLKIQVGQADLEWGTNRLGIPKNMIGLFDEEKREESQKDQKTELAEKAAP
jgi:hypothetical protein